MLDTIGLFLLYTNKSLPLWLIFIINLVAFIIGIKIIYFIFKHVLTQLTKKTKTKFDDDLLRILEYPLISALTVIFLIYDLTIFSLPKTVTNVLSKIEWILLLGIITWFLYKFIEILYKHVLVPISKKSKNNLDDQIFPLIRKTLKVVLISFALIYLLDILGINITPLLAGVGIGGLAIAFAAQKILGDVFGGVSILADQAYYVGDRVKINDKYGTVTEIGLRSTKIKTLNNTILVMPNSVVSNSIIENYTKGTKNVTVKTKIGLVYNTSNKKIDLAKKIVNDILNKNKHVVKAVGLYFSDFGDSSIDFTVIYVIDSYENWLLAVDPINREIKKQFDKNKIEFAYPTQTIYLEKNK